MGELEKMYRDLRANLQATQVSGMPKPGQEEEVRRALHLVQHAIRIRDWKRIERAVAKLAKAFLKA